MKKTKTARAARIRRHARVRKKVQGTQQRPRLAVYRSLSHIYAQVIDDERGHTIVAASTVEPALRDGSGNKTERAKAVGAALAQKAKDVGVTQVVFDRGGNRYHGRVRALAEAAREGGLQF
ncbi:MAG TPA: 50S ribosomal protein L18 [Dehalococcoidia bacterium]|nr:50S ribosomal protein L18 [Dehalococcoidia bacterium]